MKIIFTVLKIILSEGDFLKELWLVHYTTT